MASITAKVVVLLGVMFVAPAATGQPPPSYEGDCTDAGCHAEYGKRAFVHSPAEDACDACHEKVGEEGHRFKLVTEGAELCTECHDPHPGKVRHRPVAEGRCTVCHDPHGSGAKFFLRASTVSELCAECHEEITEDRTYLHGPVAAGECTACHNSHATDHPAMLFAAGREACVKCHAPMRDRITQKAFKHEPATEDCTTCHDPHGANNKMNLSASPPDLCIDCHDTIGDLMESASVKHDALTTGKACGSCHDPHASDIEHSLLREPMDLCLSCHDTELDSDNGKLVNMRQRLEENPDHHGPIRDEDCTACHNAHGGANFRMLTEGYPPGFYAPFDEDRYALCFDCHDTEAFQEERTDESTGFRNGDRNLHYLHVHRQVKGRTCRACHDVHASKKPKHIAESVPFGSWRIPINYRAEPNGGSCQPGCHRRYRYDRTTPVENVSRR